MEKRNKLTLIISITLIGVLFILMLLWSITLFTTRRNYHLAMYDTDYVYMSNDGSSPTDYYFSELEEPKEVTDKLVNTVGSYLYVDAYYRPITKKFKIKYVNSYIDEQMVQSSNINVTWNWYYPDDIPKKGRKAKLLEGFYFEPDIDVYYGMENITNSMNGEKPSLSADLFTYEVNDDTNRKELHYDGEIVYEAEYTDYNYWIDVEKNN